MESWGTGEILLAVALVVLLAACTVTDLRHRIIPNRYLAVATVVGLAIVLATDPGSLGTRALAALAASGTMLVLALVRPEGLGMGDVKLAGVMGLYLGRAVAPALLAAFAAGALAGLALIALHGREARKRTIPFGPFLALGGVVGLAFGDAAVDWYLESFS
jgi:leader peptidase (prepilin peptidase)/N-methyltransferase